MAYIGKTPSQATRSRFYFTATGGETSLSGTDEVKAAYAAHLAAQAAEMDGAE